MIGPIATEAPSSETSTVYAPVITELSTSAVNNVVHGDYCIFKGKKYAFNEKIEDGCESICKCMASSATVDCEPRCPKKNHTTATHEQCVTVPDPKDLCCFIELCDVTLDDHEQGAIAIVPAPPSLTDAMKQRMGHHTNRTSFPSTDHSPNSASWKQRDSNEKHDCEHNGDKYTIGAKKCSKYVKQIPMENLI